MLEVIKTQNSLKGFNRYSQSACEVSQFMKNFFDATHQGDTEEVETYYADEMKPLDFHLDVDWSDEVIVVDDHLATFSCALGNEARLNCVLDKSEGYWQIIHGEVQNNYLRQ